MRSLAHRISRSLPALAFGLALAAAPAFAQQAGGEDSVAAGAPDRAQEQARVIKVRILGMSCPFCAYGAEQKLKRLDGVKELEVELKSGIATLTMEEGRDVPNEKLKKTVEEAGFEAAAIVRNFESEHVDWNPEELADPEEGGGAEIGGSEAGGWR